MEIDGLGEIRIHHEYFSNIENEFVRDMDSCGVTMTIQEFAKAAEEIAEFARHREAGPAHNRDGEPS